MQIRNYKNVEFERISINKIPESENGKEHYKLFPLYKENWCPHFLTTIEINEKIIILSYFLIFISILYFSPLTKKSFLDSKYNYRKKIPLFNNLLVSIIIPVHNNFEYTYNCIYSILNSDINVSYEIIIANDMSSDETKKIGKYFKNIRVINSKYKANFLINCNQVSKSAKGKYILFLNNDTKVQKNWLTYLLELIENDETIGLVGPKFLDEVGLLKEAGRITYSNGKTISYGGGDDPNKPEYNYVKEVDYITGASILIRKSIWEKIGGFDEGFSPAYYEDTDLAYKLRNEGYKVVYQPKSVVLHFGKITNMKYLKNVKKIIRLNKKKFSKKWKKELENQDLIKDNFLRRDRGFKKNRIFVIYSFIHDSHKNEENNLILKYLEFFKIIGFQVTFLRGDFEQLEPFTTILQQKGIEVLYGEWYQNNIKNWLINYLRYFKYIYIMDNNIEKKYIDIIKNNFSGKIFYRI